MSGVKGDECLKTLLPLAVETGGPLSRLIKIQSWARGEREVPEPRGNICLLMTPVLHTVSLSNEAVGSNTLSALEKNGLFHYADICENWEFLTLT